MVSASPGGLAGGTVTFDALFTQWTVAEQVMAAGSAYLMVVKEQYLGFVGHERPECVLRYERIYPSREASQQAYHQALDARVKRIRERMVSRNGQCDRSDSTLPPSRCQPTGARNAPARNRSSG